jgi:alpha-galactosidase
MHQRHPDWTTTPGREIDPNRPFPFRTLTICLGNPVARAWIQRELERIVVEYELDLLQYDQPIIESCAVRNHGHQAGDGEYAAALGFYQLYDWLRRRFPNLLLENCMNGGHMMDFGVLQRTHLTSLTDFRDALRNRITVYGATYPFPAAACEGYMADDPALPADFLFRSYMLGLWTNSADLTAWDSAKRASARRHIALYKELRPLLRDGDVYHLLPQPNGRDWDGLQYYDPRRGQGVVFLFRPRSADARRRVRLAGLEDAEYEVHIERQPSRSRLPGRELRETGLEIVLPERFSSAIVHLRRAR